MSDETPWTIGPWTVPDANPYTVNAPVAGQVNSTTYSIAHTTGRSRGGRPDDEREANARLIAAAPRLVGLLEGAQYWLTRFDNGKHGPLSPQEKQLLDDINTLLTEIKDG